MNMDCCIFVYLLGIQICNNPYSYSYILSLKEIKLAKHCPVHQIAVQAGITDVKT